MALSEEYYDLIMPYVPDQVKSVISNQREIIDKKIDEKVNAFSEDLAAEIDRRTMEFWNEQTKQTQSKLAVLQSRVDTYADSQDAMADQLRKDSQELKTLVEDYASQIKKMGKGIRLAAFGVASSAGLKLPYDKINKYMDEDSDSGPADTQVS